MMVSVLERGKKNTAITAARIIVNIIAIIISRITARMAFPVVSSWSWRIPIISAISAHIITIKFITGIQPNNKDGVAPYIPAFIRWGQGVRFICALEGRSVLYPLTPTYKKIGECNIIY